MAPVRIIKTCIGVLAVGVELGRGHKVRGRPLGLGSEIGGREVGMGEERGGWVGRRQVRIGCLVLREEVRGGGLDLRLHVSLSRGDRRVGQVTRVHLGLRVVVSGGERGIQQVS